MQAQMLLENLSSKTEGLLYFSESEYPLTIEQWGQLNDNDVRAKIAGSHQVAANTLIPVNTADFFNAVTRIADPNDTAMVANAQKFGALYQFLQEHFSRIQVFRVEGDTSIPVYIVCHQPDNSCVALITTAIES